MVSRLASFLTCTVAISVIESGCSLALHASMATCRLLMLEALPPSSSLKPAAESWLAAVVASHVPHKVAVSCKSWARVSGWLARVACPLWPHEVAARAMAAVMAMSVFFIFSLLLAIVSFSACKINHYISHLQHVGAALVAGQLPCHHRRYCSPSRGVPPLRPMAPMAAGALLRMA